MDEPTTDQYEQQLYSMFKSFDVNNEESLERAAVMNLCDALQLEERGAALVDALCGSGAGRVSFAEFRSGLLAVLGEPRAPDQMSTAPDQTSALTDQTSAAPAEPRLSPADDHVEPNFMFSPKKYGRRSRPQHSAAGEEPGARSASEGRGRARRGTVEPALEHDRVIGREEALALCRSLRMHSIDRLLVERIFDEAADRADTTVSEFFERLNASLTGTIEEDEVGTERVAEAWERAGVRRPRRLLADLGFVSGGARLADLERALEEELRACEGPAEGRAALLAAALVLARMRGADAARARDAAAAERNKLRADVAAANERARLLAREVDESHARIETELRASVKSAEARLAEGARRAAAEVAAERERAAGEGARLEAELARARDGEARLRGEVEAARAQCDRLEARVAAAEERCAVAEREGARATARARAAEEEGARAAAAEQATRAAAARADELARENQRLQDRTDELEAALAERASPALPRPAASAPPGDALASELDSLLPPERHRDAVTEGEQEEGRMEVQGEETLREENLKLAELVKELECSLEAMRGEYEACEEYWGSKVREERAAHEREARAAADRLADLVRRIHEFERRLHPPAPALQTVPEHPALERQVQDLEAEFARYRREAAARVRALGERLARAERRRAAPPAAPPGLAARCARAELAAHRLHARLAAADLLVKDLYVENCHLAHARPLPL